LTFFFIDSKYVKSEYSFDDETVPKTADSKNDRR